MLHTNRISNLIDDRPISLTTAQIDEFLRDYLRGMGDLFDLAENHNLTLDQALDLLAHPAVARKLERIRIHLDQRTDDISAFARPDAAAQLALIASQNPADATLHTPRLAFNHRETTRKAATQFLRTRKPTAKDPATPHEPARTNSMSARRQERRNTPTTSVAPGRLDTHAPARQPPAHKPASTIDGLQRNAASSRNPAIPRPPTDSAVTTAGLPTSSDDGFDRPMNDPAARASDPPPATTAATHDPGSPANIIALAGAGFRLPSCYGCACVGPTTT